MWAGMHLLLIGASAIIRPLHLQPHAVDLPAHPQRLQSVHMKQLPPREALVAQLEAYDKAVQAQTSRRTALMGIGAGVVGTFIGYGRSAIQETRTKDFEEKLKVIEESYKAVEENFAAAQENVAAVQESYALAEARRVDAEAKLAAAEASPSNTLPVVGALAATLLGPIVAHLHNRRQVSTINSADAIDEANVQEEPLTFEAFKAKAQERHREQKDVEARAATVDSTVRTDSSNAVAKPETIAQDESDRLPPTPNANHRQEESYFTPSTTINADLTPSSESDPPISKEEAAKRAWLASARSAPFTWGSSEVESHEARQNSSFTQQSAKVPSSDIPTAAVVPPKSEGEQQVEQTNDVNSREGLPSIDTQVDSAEDAAKRAWLARLDTPTWGKAAPPGALHESSYGVSAETPSPTSSLAETVPNREDETDRQLELLSNLDPTAWARAASVVAHAAAEASKLAALDEACKIGDRTACNMLGSEDVEKIEWYGLLDESSWSAAAAAMTVMASTAMSLPSASRKDAAKWHWHAQLRAPTWSRAAAAMAKLLQTAGAKHVESLHLDASTWSAAATAISSIAELVSLDAEPPSSEVPKSPEHAGAVANVPTASADEVASLDATNSDVAEPAPQSTAAEPPHEDEKLFKRVASKLPLKVDLENASQYAPPARLDASTWGLAATVVAQIAQEAIRIAGLIESCNSGHPISCEMLANEEEPNRSWMATLDVPTWGAAAAAVSSIASSANVEPHARRALLTRLDAPAWRRAETAMTEISRMSNDMSELLKECQSGDDTACDLLAQEQITKGAWLSQLDAQSWDTAAAAVSRIASSIVAEDEAKRPRLDPFTGSFVSGGPSDAVPRPRGRAANRQHAVNGKNFQRVREQNLRS